MENSALLLSLSHTNKTSTFSLLCFQLLQSVNKTLASLRAAGYQLKDNSTNFA